MSCIKLSPCAGPLWIKTISRTMTVSCEDYEYVQLYGPIEISQGKCISKFIKSHPCDEADDVGRIILNCDYASKMVLSMIWLMIILILFTILSMFRYYKWKKQNTENGFKGTMSRNGIVIKSKTEIIKAFGWKKTLLFLLLGINMSKACLSPINMFRDKDKLHVTFTYDGIGTICTNFGDIHLRTPTSILDFTHVYSTQDWHIKTNATWCCGGGSCPSSEVCENMNMKDPYIVRSSREVIREFCNEKLGGCAFSRGNWIGYKIIQLKDPVYEVYEASRFIKVIDNHEDFCEFNLESPVMDIIKPFSLLRSSNSKFMACSLPPNKGHAIPGLLGDLQRIDNSFLFDWGSLVCADGWYEDQTCKSKESFATVIPRICHELPTIINGISLFLDEGVIKGSLQEKTTLTIHCNKSIQIMAHNDPCEIKEISKYGIRHLGTGIHLVIKAYNKNPSMEMTIENPCGLGSLQIPCDNNPYVFSIENEDLCGNLTDKTITLHQSGFVNNVYSNTPGLYSLAYIAWHDYPSLAISGLSGLSTIIIIILIILLVCRK